MKVLVTTVGVLVGLVLGLATPLHPVLIGALMIGGGVGALKLYLTPG